jgi:hypothetical protein
MMTCGAIPSKDQMPLRISQLSSAGQIVAMASRVSTFLLCSTRRLLRLMHRAGPRMLDKVQSEEFEV